MNKLPKEKRDQIIVAALVMVMVLVVIWMFLISPQLSSRKSAGKNMSDQQHHLQDMLDSIKKADTTDKELQSVTNTLAGAEADMASNDPNAWAYELIRHFKEHYKVDISSIGQASIGDVDLIPNMPFRQLRVSVGGTAYYHDLGEFIADFENQFPHIRVANLSIQPVGGNGDSAEKLNFHMDIVALIKTDQ